MLNHALMGWANEPQLTAHELAQLEAGIRYEYATRALGIKPSSRSIFRVLAVREGKWTISKIARATGLSRRIVQKTLKKSICRGLAFRRLNHYGLTPSGRGLLARGHRETLKIVLGRQTGFSAEMIEYYRNLPGVKVNPRAEFIEFSDDLPFILAG